MIDFSITKQTNANSPAVDAVYATRQVRTILSMEDFAQHIKDHGSTWSVGDLVGILYTIVNCLKEEVLNGNGVELGQLGTFYPALSSTGYKKSGKKPEEFTADDIKKVTIGWRRGIKIKNMRSEAQLNLVVSRKEQAIGVKNVRTGLIDTTQGGSGTGM